MIYIKFPDDFETFEYDRCIYNGEKINRFIKIINSNENNTEIIIQDGLMVFKKNGKVYVVTTNLFSVSGE